MLTSKEQKRVADEISNSSNVIGKGTVLEGSIETYGNIRMKDGSMAISNQNQKLR